MPQKKRQRDCREFLSLSFDYMFGERSSFVPESFHTEILEDKFEKNLVARCTDAAERVRSRYPGKELAIAGFLAAMTQACAGFPVHFGAERAQESPELHAGKQRLEAYFDDPGTKENEGKRIVQLMLERNVVSREKSREIFQERLHGKRTAVDFKTHIPQEETVNNFISFLPPIMTSHETAGNIHFSSKDKFPEMKGVVFSLKDRKDKTLQPSCFANPNESPEEIYCNLDTFGKRGIRYSVMNYTSHEFAHTGDPSELPMAAEDKLFLWEKLIDVLENEGRPRFAYPESIRTKDGKSPVGNSKFSQCQELWAEIFSNANMAHAYTVESHDWESWKDEFEFALVAMVDADPVGAKKTAELYESYFRIVDPTFQPWESAKKIDKWFNDIDHDGNKRAVK